MAVGLRGSETGEAAMLSSSMAPAGGRVAGSRDGRRSREEDIRDVWRDAAADVKGGGTESTEAEG